MSASQSQIRTVVSALKKIIKKKGLTYKDVALKLKLSEQTIKRFFTDDDVSLSRLADICELVDVPLDELFSAALKQKTPAYRLTVAQEEFLVEHPGLFGLYSKLAEGMKTQEIRRRFGISESTMRQSLRLLEKGKLLERGVGDCIKLLNKGNHSWVMGGPLQKKFLLEREVAFTHKHVGEVAQTGKLATEVYLNSSEYELRPETWSDFVSGVSKAVNDVHEQSLRERPFCKENERKPYHWLLVMAPEEFICDHDIMNLAERQ
jgi:DNA-binding Xre family transcriptional regulator